MNDFAVIEKITNDFYWCMYGVFAIAAVYAIRCYYRSTEQFSVSIRVFWATLLICLTEPLYKKWLSVLEEIIQTNERILWFLLYHILFLVVVFLSYKLYYFFAEKEDELLSFGAEHRELDLDTLEEEDFAYYG